METLGILIFLFALLSFSSGLLIIGLAVINSILLKLGIKIKFIDKILDYKIYNSSKKKSALILSSLVLMFIGGSLIPESNELEVNSRTIASEESQLESEEELALKEQEEKERKEQEEKERKEQEEKERKEQEEKERKEQEEKERKEQEEKERKEQEEKERKEQEEKERKEQEEKERKEQEEKERKEQEEKKVANNIPNSLVASVVRVVDGDTIIVSINGNEERVRFLLVDTPETVHPNKPVEPFGPEASDFVKSRLEGKNVILQRDISERDRYSRLLFYVYDIEGNSIQEELLERGLARVSVYPPDVKYVDHYREIQSEAQRKALGIWSIENYAQESQQSSKNSSSNSTPPPSTNTESNSGKGLIKGNISSSGEKIYHVPGGAFYDRTIIDEAAGERWFHTESEAVEAGWRKSQR